MGHIVDLFSWHELKALLFVMILSMAVIMTIHWSMDIWYPITQAQLKLYVAGWLFTAATFLTMIQSRWMWVFLSLALGTMSVTAFLNKSFVWSLFIAILYLESSKNIFTYTDPKNRPLVPSWTMGRWSMSYVLSSLIFTVAWLVIATIANEPTPITSFFALWFSTSSIILLGQKKIEGWIANMFLYGTVAYFYWSHSIFLLAGIFGSLVIISMVSLIIWTYEWYENKMINIKELKILKDSNNGTE